VFTRAELEAIADVAQRHDLLVISDEIWGDLVYPGARHIPFASVSPQAASRTVTLVSASKPFNLAGLRCAVAHIGPDVLADKVAALPSHLLGGVGSPGAVASRAAWTEGGGWLDATVAFLRQQRDHVAARVAAELPAARMAVPEATYLAWIDFSGYGVGDDPSAWLLEHAKVALGVGPEFGEHGRGFARLNFATTRPVLDAALDRIVAALG
ncbi:MAG: aminotransferase class I/II-fold pyridoxal phosphate-dependent enzyme, partial [Actinomycetia bacterium]|nr:aminotransferase class I/II-fold pyridoxal phosphate-dependent enzyme [Actinomycetes bacterium]